MKGIRNESHSSQRKPQRHEVRTTITLKAISIIVANIPGEMW